MYPIIIRWFTGYFCKKLLLEAPLSVSVFCIKVNWLQLCDHLVVLLKQQNMLGFFGPKNILFWEIWNILKEYTV